MLTAYIGPGLENTGKLTKVKSVNEEKWTAESKVDHFE